MQVGPVLLVPTCSFEGGIPSLLGARRSVWAESGIVADEVLSV